VPADKARPAAEATPAEETAPAATAEPTTDALPTAETAPAAGAAPATRTSRPLASRAVIALVIGLPLVLAAILIAVIAFRGGSTPHPQASSPAQGSSSAPGLQATSNPQVDPGTRLPGTAAPGFTLTNQFGTPVSLSQFHGKAVVLAFVDSECTTICPLTTVSMTEAVRMLGPDAARHIQLLGIDANPDATAVSDVRAYSTAHEMLHSWNFLTGSKSQLEAVWRDYHVYVAASHADIDHEPAIYLIDPDGKERILYLTQMAYASVEQQAELIAGGLSQVLPGHPAVHGGVSMALATSIGPAAAVGLPVIAGDRSIQQVQFGAGHPHVVVFVTSWIGEVSDLQAQLQVLADYQHEAIQHGWPTVVAVDETKSETTPGALLQLLARTGPKNLNYPIVADTTGRVADGYGVQDIPWVEVISPDGKIIYKHDGWVPAATLAQQAAHAKASPVS
jgi:cytochrome oxidase Cu insertion factor (SCO1/SenC/PrrC family)